MHPTSFMHPQVTSASVEPPIRLMLALLDKFMLLKLVALAHIQQQQAPPRFLPPEQPVSSAPLVCFCHACHEFGQSNYSSFVSFLQVTAVSVVMLIRLFALDQPALQGRRPVLHTQHVLLAVIFLTSILPIQLQAFNVSHALPVSTLLLQVTKFLLIHSHKH